MFSRYPTLMLMVLALNAQAADPKPASLDAGKSLLAAEWAFVRHAEAEGIKASFLAVFHPDAILFHPGPVNGPRLYAGRPETGASLKWYPAVSEVASSGDLGYTTGPSEYRAKKDAAEVYHGWFVSLWRREGRDPWKLMIDLGTSNPAPAAKIPALTEFKGLPAPLPKDIAPSPSPELMDTDRAFAKKAAEEGTLAAYDAFVHDQVRIYREGAHPVEGRKSIKGILLTPSVPVKITWEPTASLVSHAKDLGCTYGMLTRTMPSLGRVTQAHYVRIWKREKGQGPWKVVLEIENPLPEGKP